MVANYALIDIEDAQEFQKFAMHALRLKIEFNTGQWSLPFAMLQHVGHIHTYYPDFPKLIERRFTEKTNALAKLRGITAAVR